MFTKKAVFPRPFRAVGISRWNGRNGVQCHQWYQEIATGASALACEPAGEYPASNRRRRLLASRNDTRGVSKARRFQLRYANKQSVTFSILSAVFHSAGLDHRGLGVTDFPAGLPFLVVLFLFHSFHSLSPLFLPWMRKICADLPRLAGTKLKKRKRSRTASAIRDHSYSTANTSRSCHA